MSALEGLEDFAGPVAKRQKLDESGLSGSRSGSTGSTGSRLFAPFRTIGLISPTSVPFTSVPLGKTTFQVTTSVGRRIQTYDLRRGLNLVFLSSPPCPETITATLAYRDRVFVAWGSAQSKKGRGIWVFKRGRAVAELASDGSIDQDIQKIVVFGTWIVGCGSQGIDVWKNETYEHYTSIRLNTSNASLTGTITTLPTFINKIVVGKTDGAIEIYNVSSGRLVHTIEPASSSAGAVCCLAAAPATGLLAASWADGSLKILDVETEEVVISFRHANGRHAVTSISFRTDGEGAGDDGRSDGIMATACVASGDVSLWDLDKGGKIAGTLRAAHETSSASTSSGITGIEFLPGQPVLITSGLDNALRSWVFDQVPSSIIPRILHARSGHAASVSHLKFLPAATDGSEANGKWLLSAGTDRSLWGFSLRKDGQSAELSQGNIKHKAKKVGKSIIDESNIEDFKCPPIISIACSLNRDGGMGSVVGPVWKNATAANAEEAAMTGWESVVTAHQNDKYARTWLWGRKKAGRWAFETADHQPVTSVAISACGTFALVGSAGGALDMHNLQSGVHRQRFPPKLKPAQAKQLKLGQMSAEQLARFSTSHKKAITGIAIDPMNRIVVSTSLDGLAIFWDFSTGQIIEGIQLEGTPMAVRYNSVSGLMSIACDDLCIRVLDTESKKVVRELWGCVGQINDHCFSHDGRWIVACSMDSIVRTFDIATGHLIDAFRTRTCTNIAMSSTGEYLATAHAGDLGISIWNNKSLYTTIPQRQIDEQKDLIDLTNTIEFEFDAATQLADSSADQDSKALALQSTRSDIDQIDAALLTLSLQPQSRWQTLLNLESIRQRNKPIQPPRKPKAAPFFLGSALTNGHDHGASTLEIGQDTPSTTKEKSSRISRLSSLQPVKSVLSTHLQEFEASGDEQTLTSYLSSLSPSAADLELRSLTMQEMPVFVRALTAHLSRRRDYELVNAWLAVFLKLHSEFVTGVDDVRNAVLEYQQTIQAEQARLSNSVGWARGVVEFLRSSR